jgi:anti-sigma-K factor RskA
MTARSHGSGRPAGPDPATSRWLDGLASPEEARRIEGRIAADPGFAAEVERLRGDLDLFRADVATRRPSGSLADRVLAAVAAGGSASGDEERFQAAARRWAAAAAVLAAVGVGGSVMIDRIAPPAEAGDAAALTTFVETNRFSLEIDLALDQRQVAAPADASSPSPSDSSPR